MNFISLPQYETSINTICPSISLSAPYPEFTTIQSQSRWRRHELLVRITVLVGSGWLSEENHRHSKQSVSHSVNIHSIRQSRFIHSAVNRCHACNPRSLSPPFVLFMFKSWNSISRVQPPLYVIIHSSIKYERPSICDQVKEEQQMW